MKNYLRHSLLGMLCFVGFFVLPITNTYSQSTNPEDYVNNPESTLSEGFDSLTSVALRSVPTEDELLEIITTAQTLVQKYREDVEELTEDQIDFVVSRIQALYNNLEPTLSSLPIESGIQSTARKNIAYFLEPRLEILDNGFLEVVITLNNIGNPFFLGDASFNLRLIGYDNTSQTPLILSQTERDESKDGPYSSTSEEYQEMTFGSNPTRGLVTLQINLAEDEIYIRLQSLPLRSSFVAGFRTKGDKVLPGKVDLGAIQIPISQSGGEVKVEFDNDSYLYISKPTYQNIYNPLRALSKSIMLDSIMIVSSNATNEICFGGEISFSSNRHLGNQWQVSNDQEEFEDVPNENGVNFTTNTLTQDKKVRAVSSLGFVQNQEFENHISNSISNNIVQLKTEIIEIGGVCEESSNKYTSISEKGNSYEWSIGTDPSNYQINGVSNDDTLNVTWLTPGEYSVRLKYFSNDASINCPPVFDEIVQIVNPKVTASIGLSDELCETGEVIYSANVDNGGSYAWYFSGIEGNHYSFINNTSAESISPEVVWRKKGDYKITLEVTNAKQGENCISVIADTILQTVSPSATASINPVAELCQTGVDSLSATVTNGGIYTWIIEGQNGVDYNYTSGNSPQTIKPEILWVNAGDYNISLTVDNPKQGAGCTPAIADGIVKTVNPTATVEIIEPIEVCESGVNTLEAEVSSVSSYSWIIGGTNKCDYNYQNGTDSSSANPIIRWINAGNYSIDLVVTNEKEGLGCNTVSASSQIQIVNPAVVFSKINTLDSLCQSGEIDYSFEGENFGNILWTFGGVEGEDYSYLMGTNNESISPRLRWDSPGDFPVSIKVFNIEDFPGCFSRSSEDSIQKVFPTAEVQINPIEEICNTGIQKYSAIVENVGTYQWGTDASSEKFNLKNKTKLDSAIIDVEWLEVGDYQISLLVTNIRNFNGCVDVSESSNQLVNNRAEMVLDPSGKVCQDGEITYTATADYVGSYAWGILGQNTYTLINSNFTSEEIAVTYADSGDYKIVLKVTSLNEGLGCGIINDTVSQRVNHTITSQTLPVPNVCENGVLTFQGFTNDGVQYNWEFGGTSESSFLPGFDLNSDSLERIYTSDGTGTAVLTMTTPFEGNGCVDGVSDLLEFTVHKAPAASIETLELRCEGDEVEYTAQIGHTEGADFSWSFFGKNATTNLFEIIPEFTQTGDTATVSWINAGDYKIVLKTSGPDPGVLCDTQKTDSLIQVVRSIEVTIDSVDRLEIGEEAVLSADGIISGGDESLITYSWTTNDTLISLLSNNGQEVTVAPLADSVEYSVTVENEVGCQALASVKVGLNIFVTLSAEVMIEGPFDPSTSLMKNELKTGDDDYLTEVYGYEEKNIALSLIDENVFGIKETPRMNEGFPVPENAVDIVELSLRSIDNGADIIFQLSNPDTTKYTRQWAWLLTDGSIRDFKTGTTNVLKFYNQEFGADNEFHLVVRHRNHLTIMSKILPMNYLAQEEINLFSSPEKIYGNANLLSVFGTTFTMPAGEVDGNQVVNVIDRNEVSTDSQRGEEGYRSSNGNSTDINLNGIVNAEDINIVEKNLSAAKKSNVPNP
jgi:hypothetical protein